MERRSRKIGDLLLLLNALLGAALRRALLGDRVSSSSLRIIRSATLTFVPALWKLPGGRSSQVGERAEARRVHDDPVERTQIPVARQEVGTPQVESGERSIAAHGFDQMWPSPVSSPRRRVNSLNAAHALQARGSDLCWASLRTASTEGGSSPALRPGASSPGPGPSPFPTSGDARIPWPGMGPWRYQGDIHEETGQEVGAVEGDGVESRDLGVARCGGCHRPDQ